MDANELARVDEALAAGNDRRAREELRLLVRYHPTRLDLRERLAELYREAGDPAQAGRWSLLADEVDPDELEAFHAAYPDPVRRMSALEWTGTDDDAPTPAARERLARVRRDAELAVGYRLTWAETRERLTPDERGPSQWAVLKHMLAGASGSHLPWPKRILWILGGVALVAALITIRVLAGRAGIEVDTFDY